MAAAWQPRRLHAVEARLPEGMTPPGTRGRILHAGLRTFAEFGFYGASIRDIAAEAGVNSATLYAHYASKEHILAALILHGHEELHRRLQEAIVRAGSRPADQLEALVRAHTAVHTEYPLLALVANSELHTLSTEQALAAVTLREQSRALLLHVLVRGVDEGAFRMQDPLLTALALAGMGMRVATWFGPDVPFTADQVADAHVEMALRMVDASDSDSASDSAADDGEGARSVRTSDR